MPLYEYQCDACSHRFEVIQKYSDSPIDVCPKCGGTVKKLLSSPAIQFKGSGWYITDYARSGKTDSGSAASAKAEKSEKGSTSDSASAAKSDTGSSSGESKSEGKSESKGESKSETKTESKPSTPSNS
jgi:putative FmdB family regulatory protein